MKNNLLKTLSIAAIIFGVITVLSGGRALFGDAAAQAAVGNAVGFVLWFNFLAGFAYVLVGAALWRGRRWASWGAGALALATAAELIVQRGVAVAMNPERGLVAFDQVAEVAGKVAGEGFIL